MQWNDGYDEKVFTFANNINTPEGGTHLSGFKAALTRTINAYAERGGLWKDIKEPPTGEDAREGLAAVISVKIPQPQFEGQTKQKLGNSEVKGLVEQIVNEQPCRTGSRRTRRTRRRSSGRLATPRGPASPPGRPARRCAARACSTARRCRASWPTAARRTRRSPSCSSSRATRQAAPPSRAATP